MPHQHCSAALIDIIGVARGQFLVLLKPIASFVAFALTWYQSSCGHGRHRFLARLLAHRMLLDRRHTEVEVSLEQRKQIRYAAKSVAQLYYRL